jgi:hypothetical protein
VIATKPHVCISARALLTRWGPPPAERYNVCDACDWNDTTIGGEPCGHDLRPETDHEFWTRKLWAAHDSGLSADIVANGVREPIRLGADAIADGHHRLAVMLDHDPDRRIPVLFHKGDDQ